MQKVSIKELIPKIEVDQKRRINSVGNKRNHFDLEMMLDKEAAYFLRMKFEISLLLTQKQ